MPGCCAGRSWSPHGPDLSPSITRQPNRLQSLKLKGVISTAVAFTGHTVRVSVQDNQSASPSATARLLPFAGIFFSFWQEMEFDCLNYCIQSLPVFHGSPVTWGRKELSGS